MLKQMYLVAYNCAAMLGWALVLYITVTSYLNNDTPTVLWSKVGYTLTIVRKYHLHFFFYLQAGI